MQESFAKGVDCLDLDPTRCFNGPRKKPPGLREANSVGILAIQFFDFLRKVKITQSDPLAQFFKHPVRHIGRSRLRIGERQNSGWIRAIKQKT